MGCYTLVMKTAAKVVPVPAAAVVAEVVVEAGAVSDTDLFILHIK